MTVHEAMHAYAGYALGDDTAKNEGRLTLNPIAHIDPVGTLLVPILLAVAGAPIFGAAKPVPFNPSNLRGGDFGAATVALAGPFTNLALAVLGAGILTIVGNSGFMGQALLYFIVVNVGFFVFNMIPFPPLDGSRFLYAVAPAPVREAMRAIESFGFMAIIVFIFLFLSFLREPFTYVLSGIVEFLTGVSFF
jgi:Zn-dependent protease